MADINKLRKNLEKNGFHTVYFDTARGAADYLDGKLDGRTIGMGGSVTIQELGLMERLSGHNTFYSHWSGSTLDQAAGAEVYLCSVNGAAETGELINIDGTGNRVAATLNDREKVVFITGINKVAEDFHQALWRARNIAAPLNARRLNRKTPCALKEEMKCYDCKSPERICNGLTVLWRKMGGVKECEVVLIQEELGY